MKLVYCLKIISENPIKLDNGLLTRNWILLSDARVKYVPDNIVSREMINTGMGRNDIIQVVS